MGFETPQGPKLERKSSEAFPNAHWEKRVFELNGRVVEMHGVAHHTDTFEMYGDELKEAVKRASIVLVEGAPEAEGLGEPKQLMKVAEAMEASGMPKPSLEALQTFIEKRPELRFFRQIEHSAAEEGKMLAVADPLTFENWKPLDARDDSVTDAKVGLAIGGTLAVVGQAIEERKRKIPRRSFLKGILGAAAVVAGASIIRDRKATSSALKYDEKDYRDVMVAEGLDRLTKLASPDDGPIVVIYGADHSEPVLHYATSPKERTVKAAAYAPYRTVSRPELHLFEFDQANGVWKRGSVMGL